MVSLTGINWGTRPAIEYAKSPGLMRMTCLDQARFNIAYLAFPEIEALKSVAGASPQFIAGIHKFMTPSIREHALRLPLPFMRFFSDKHQRMSLILPENYLGIMWTQAHRVQARLVEPDGNVVRVLFRV